jgi:hypothetical protein
VVVMVTLALVISAMVSASTNIADVTVARASI